MANNFSEAAAFDGHLLDAACYLGENEPKLLDEVLTDMRTIKLDTSKMVKADQGETSEWFPITFLDPKGKQVSGCFTKKNKLDAAMNTVADLLGVSHVIARSTPMKITTEDGIGPVRICSIS